MRNIGRQIRRRRILLKISQTVLAEKIGKHYSWLGLVERGRLAIDDATARKILEAIDLYEREVISGETVSYDGVRLRDRRVKAAASQS